MKKLLVHILSVVVTTVFAQSPAILSDYTTQHGLPSNSIRGLAIDNHRQLWLSTDNGLYLFSNSYGTDTGKRLFQEKRGVADESHICSNDLNMLYADRHEPVLWIATRSSGLDAYHYDEGRFVHYRPQSVSDVEENAANAADGKSRFLPDGSVTSISPWREHTLWLTSYQGGFCSLDKRTDLFRHYNHTTVSGLPNDSLWCVVPLSDNSLVVGHTNAGISIVDLKSQRAANYPICHCFSEKYVAEDGVRSIALDKYRNLWLGTEKGLALFDMKSKKAREIRGIRGLVTHVSINGDTIYACTRDMGLCSLSLTEALRNPGKVKVSQLDLSAIGLSSSLPITSLLIDNNGHRYIGTLEEGLVLARKSAPYIKTIDLPAEIEGNVTSLLALSNHDIWIGTFQNGLYRWNVRTGKCHPVNLVDANGGKRIFVNALASWRGKVMVATGQGLFEVSPNNESYKCHNKSAAGLSTGYITAIAKDRHDRIWCGGAFGDLDILDSTLHRICHISKGQLGVDLAIRYIVPLGGDTIAVTTGNGISLLDSKSLARIAVIGNTTADSMLTAPLTVSAMLADKHGRLLCFTTDGVWRREADGFVSLYPCEQSDLLANCHVATLMPDGNVLWFANRKLGIMGYHPLSSALQSSSGPFTWWILAGGIVLLAAGIFTVTRKHRHKPTPVQETIKENLEESTEETSEPNAFVQKLNTIVDSLDSLATLNRDSLTEHMCMSKSTLYRKMKQELDKSPNEWIRTKRLERAHQLLVQGLNVSETADRVGLDPAYLARCYKEQYGVYPSEIKK